MDTGFKDKNGKPIRVGDTVQIMYPGKTGGPVESTIAKVGNRYVSITPRKKSPDIVTKLDDNETARMTVL